jgi:hypothetical protein
MIGVAHGDLGPDPLFAADDVIEVRIEAPFRNIMDKRPIDEDTPATLQFIDTGGNAVRLDIGLRTRGRFRHRPDICDFAPLRLNIKKSNMGGTLFENQDKLKLVTHCKGNSPRYEQIVLSEYLVYRTLNILTDISFRVRLLRVTYVDTSRSDSERVSLAFLIEHRDRLAKRIDAPVIETRMVTFPDLNQNYTNLISVFHYFIGNTDFSPIATAPDEDCCHNHDLFAKEGEPIFSVPYDFDMSGFVNAPHAAPSPRFRLRNVRQRLYRGRCANNAHLPASVENFIERRNEIYALINEQELMTNSTRKAMLQFVDRFYKTLDSPKKIEKEFISECM